MPPEIPACAGMTVKATAKAVALAACMAAVSVTATPQDVLIRNATVHTAAAQGSLNNTDVLVQNGKIAAIGRNLRGS